MEKIVKELERFVAENPTADTLEIAEHFYELGKIKALEEWKPYNPYKAAGPLFTGD